MGCVKQIYRMVSAFSYAAVLPNFFVTETVRSTLLAPAEGRNTTFQQLLVVLKLTPFTGSSGDPIVVLNKGDDCELQQCKYKQVRRQRGHRGPVGLLPIRRSR